MESDLLLFLLGGGLIFTGFNLWLTFRLIKTVKYLRLNAEVKQSLPAGQLIEKFDAVQLINDQAYNTALAEAKVYIFLSSGCDKCKDKLPEVNSLRAAACNAGVGLWILSAEEKKYITTFLSGTDLANYTLLIDDVTYDYLNPLGASPYYLFVDDENTLQTDGFIGDENWLTFVGQVTGSERKAS